MAQANTHTLYTGANRVEVNLKWAKAKEEGSPQSHTEMDYGDAAAAALAGWQVFRAGK